MTENENAGVVDFDALMKKKKAALFFKRCFDVFASLFGLMFLAIPFIFIAIAIKASSKGPVYFRQERVGKNGKHFRIFKDMSRFNTSVFLIEMMNHS